MRPARSETVIAFALLIAAGCHPGPIIGGDPHPAVGGIVSGTVTATGAAPLVGRTIALIETATNRRYRTTIASNGGYTLQVPMGTYRSELELLPGERVSKGS